MKLKGKQLSLSSKMLAVFIACTALFMEIITGVTIPMNDVIKVSLFVALVFSPVDISLWVETFFQSFSSGRKKAPPSDEDKGVF